MLGCLTNEVVRCERFIPTLNDTDSLFNDTLAYFATCIRSTVLPTRELAKRFCRGEVKAQEVEWLRMNHAKELAATPLKTLANMVQTFIDHWLMGCVGSLVVMGVAQMCFGATVLFLTPQMALAYCGMSCAIASAFAASRTWAVLMDGCAQMETHLYGVISPKWAALHQYRQELIGLKNSIISTCKWTCALAVVASIASITIAAKIET